MIETVKKGFVRVMLGLGLIFIALASKIDKDYIEAFLTKQREKK